MKKIQKRAYILGAGVAGFAAGWKLSESGYKVTVIEKLPFAGGMATTFKYKNFLFDLGPHKIFSLMKDVMKEVFGIIGKKNLLKVKKKSRIYMNSKFLVYPVTLVELLKKLGIVTCFVCGISFLKAEISNIFKKPHDKSFADWVRNRYGNKIYSLIFAPYARKIWGDPEKLAVELASTRIASPSLWEIIRQMVLKLPAKSVINAEYFYYPKKGVITMSEKMMVCIRKKGGTLKLNSGVTKIEISKKNIKRLHLSDGRKFDLNTRDIVVSTIPLPILLNVLHPTPPISIKLKAEKLKTRNLILFYLIINKKSISDDSWLFFPEEKFLFNRIFEQKNFSKFMIPKNRTSLCLEITCPDNSPVWNMTTDALYEKLILQIEETGLIKKSDVISYFDKRLKFAYPIYDLGFRKNLDSILDWTDTVKNLYTIGRQGAFGYTGTLDSIHMGFTLVKHINKSPKKEDWRKEREVFKSYVVVD